MLLDECARAGADIRLQCETEAITNENGFHLQTSQGKFSAETLVVATGGLSVPSLGGSAFGYELATQFGLGLLPTIAGLVPFTFTDSVHEVCNRLSGVSLEAVLSNERASFQEDILFTHRGLSGPAALQLSSYWKPGEGFTVNLLPEMTTRETLMEWKQNQPGALLRTRLSHHLPRKLVMELETLWWWGFHDTALAEIPDRLLLKVADHLSAWRLKPAATEGYRTAEVTLGGVDTRDLSSKTMQSPVPGLFFIGEVVDVTGHLGGFNFQWAWSSGWVAGKSV
jgi:predicted Rossmann fold flavoprotein